MNTPEKVIYKELSFKIVGVLFEVYNELGFGYKEKTYEEAIALLLKDKNINFKRQICYQIKFRGKIIGKNFLDFLIEDKVVLEIKKGRHYSKKNMDQVNQYLKITGLRLAILANFTPDGVTFFRLLN